MKPLVVSFATPSYQDELQRLVASCERFGLDVYAESLPGTGSWLRNCAMKPSFLFRACTMHAHRDILWLDADAEIMAWPETPEIDTTTRVYFDIAVHKFRGSQVASGTIFLPFDGRREDLCAQWSVLQARRLDQDDQTVLADVIPSYEVLWLPPSMCWIDDLSQNFYSIPEPIIVAHHQASRRKRHVPD